MSAFALDSTNLFESSQYGALAINTLTNVRLPLDVLVGENP